MDDMATYAVATTIVRNITKELDLVGFLLEHSGDDAGDTALTTLSSSMIMVGSRYTAIAEKLSKMENERTSVLESRYTAIAEKLSKMENERTSVLDGQQSIDDALGQGRN